MEDIMATFFDGVDTVDMKKQVIRMRKRYKMI